MKRLRVLLFILAVLPRQTCADTEHVQVTKATQKELGLEFSVAIARSTPQNDNQALIISAPLEGKLKHLFQATLLITDRKGLFLSVPVDMRLGDPKAEGRAITVLNLSKALLDHASLYLHCGKDKGGTETRYTIVLKTYSDQ